MQKVIEEFEERVKDTEKYLRVLECLESPTVILYDKSTRRRKKVFEDGSFKVMKATVFLLIYNLVESSIRSAFAELYSEIANSGTPPGELRSELRELWIRQTFHKLDKDSAALRNFREITKGIIDHYMAELPLALEAEHLPISGNLGCSEIRKTCLCHGITAKVHRHARGGIELETVKLKRNHLAHGNISFSDCGKEYTVSDLKRINREAILFIRGTIRSIENFINSKGFVAK